MPGVTFFLLQAIFGWIIFPWFDPQRKFPLVLRIVGGAMLGWVVTGYVVLGLALWLHSLPLALGLTMVAMATAAAVIYRSRRKKVVALAVALVRWSCHAARRPLIWVVVGLAAVVVTLELQVLLPAPAFPHAIVGGWGDAALHLAIIQRLRTADPFTLEHPVLAGHLLPYPFLVDFLSAIYLKLGAPLLFAYHLPAVVLVAAVVVLLVYFYRWLIPQRGLAVLLVGLALFGAGLGWVVLGRDLGLAWRVGGIPAVVATLGDLPHQYTHLDTRTSGKPPGFETPENIVWIVPAISFLTHQRSFPLGLAMGLMILLGAMRYGETLIFPRYGLIAGLLPLAHGHTLLALAIVFFGVLLVRWRWWRRLVAFAAVTALVATPSLWYLRQALTTGGTATAVLGWWWGWMTCAHQQHWFACDVPAAPGTDTSVLWFWIKNFGLVFVAWAMVLAYRLVTARRPRTAAGSAPTSTWPLLVPSLLLFVLPNLVRFQPWEFDNNKVLFWWWLLALGVIGQGLAAIRWPAWRRGVVAVVAVSVLLAGVTDVWSQLGHWRTYHYPYVGQSELEAAAWIRANLPPNARVVGAPTPNHFVPLLTGRPLALGYEGWLLSEGLDVTRRRRTIDALVRGDATGACLEDLAYVVADRSFYQSFPVDQSAFDRVVTPRWLQRDPANGPRVIFQVMCPTRQP